ncbi:MAG: biotin--[Firmicutes bacterium]|nr:biotin--[acetyl-CoA-carboxylase] ligase [Bacillota bacterium]
MNSVDSTNNYIKTLSLGDVPRAVIALEQTAGRGTHGRSFWSPAGSGIYLTIGFRPDAVGGVVRDAEVPGKLDSVGGAPLDAAPETEASADATAPHEMVRQPLSTEQIQTVTRMAGVAVRRVLARYSLDEPRIKPVNDILIDGRKVAGILTEGITEGVGRFSAIYVGIGVNCFEAALPEELRDTAGWISRPAREFTVMELARDIIDEFLGLLADLDVEKVLREYEEWRI